MITEVFCVACESEETGLVNWHINAQGADQQYAEFTTDPDLATDTITRFNVKVDDLISPDALSDQVDSAMWAMNYKPISRRVGTQNYMRSSSSMACA